ncbi:MAG: SpoIIE family protein phosphatase [Candidatus Ancaeobacter aquaticus]|nr:SpoIIE family protein phosphatase [Candidatus Ancaeobacter aquaticus]
MFKKLSVRLACVTILIMTMIIGVFTYYLVHDRSTQLYERILEKGVTAAKIGATSIGRILEELIDNGVYTEDQIFEQTLVAEMFSEKVIEGYRNESAKDIASMRKYHYQTGLDTYLDDKIVGIEDKFLEDPQFVYAAVMDMRGYAPAHNSIYSKPLTGDFAIDRAYSRCKRIYTDRVAKTVCENRKESYLRQIYERDMGDVIWDISSPIIIKERHWGAFRIGLSMDKAQKAIAALQWKLISMMVVLLIMVAFVVSRITTVMMRPLHDLHEGVDKVSRGDLSYEQRITSRDEVGDLAVSFNKMVKDLKDYIQRLKETTAIKERMEHELKIAHDIQMSIVPKIFPAFPHRPEFDIYAVLKPAKEVGGDFYDFFFIDETRFCFVIGDVSGKGVPASLFMAVAKTLIKSIAKETQDPSEILDKVNKELLHENDSYIFVTIFCGIMDIRTGVIEYACGGHNPPVVIRENGSVDFLNGSRSTVVGVLEEAIYIKDTLTLATGDTFFMYTDGVTEAFNADHQQFSEQRLRNGIESHKEDTVKKLVVDTLDEINTFTRGVPQSDDITLMVLRYFGPKA